MLPFVEPGEERRGVGSDVAMAECRLAGPSAGGSEGGADTDGFRTYYVVVLSLGGLGAGGAALAASAALAGAGTPTALLEVHCSGAAQAECVSRPLPWLARALVARTLALADAASFESRRGGAPLPEAEQRALDAGHAVHAHLDGGGAIFAAVNRHPQDSFLARSTVDAAGDPIVARRDPRGPARGAAATSDTLAPLHAQLLQVASYSAAGRSMHVSSGRTTGLGGGGGGGAAPEHSPPLDALFAPFPLFVP